LAAVGALGVNIVLLVFVVIQLRLLQTQISDASNAFASEQLRIKRQSTLEHLATTMAHRQDVSKDVPPDTDLAAVKEFSKDADSNNPNGRLLRNYLNYYENLATGINCGVFDVEIAARTSGTVIVRVFDVYQDFIYRIREATGHSLAYCEMEALVQNLRPYLDRLADADARRLPGVDHSAVAVDDRSGARRPSR
jgi:hypothetical protein